MLRVAPSSRWQMTRSGFITSMSPVVAMLAAVTSPGPVALSCSRFGWSPSMRSAICLTLRTRSVTASRTPATEENSCSTPAIRSEVTAAPCSEESSTRRSELPSVSPKPRSSGSATKVALRRLSPAAFFSRALGFFISCQFFALTAMIFPWFWAETSAFEIVAKGPRGRPFKSSDAAALGRAHAVVRDRGDVPDRGDLEADRLQRAQRRLAARTRSLDLHLERADAMLGGLLARILGGDLGGIGGRFARPLEAHHAGRRPGDGIALRVGDGDHRIVEAGVHVGDAGGDVLALAPSEALRFACHWFSLPNLLL